MPTLVITGGTRGLGRAVVDWVLAEPGWRVIVMGRGSATLPGLSPENTARVQIVPTELSDLRAVARACDDVIARLGPERITALALNAGLNAIRGNPVSADGYELHFAVNHLAHVLIADRLAPHMEAGGHIVLTSSETHDPDAFSLFGISRAVWQDPAEFADATKSQMQVPDEVNRGESRYSLSKLCNAMHAHALAAEYPQLVTASFNPSVVGATGIARDRNAVQVYLWGTLLPLLSHVLPWARTLAQSSGDLAWLLTKADLKAVSGSYFDGRRAQPGSADSRDPAKIDRLMVVSRQLIADALSKTASTAKA